MGNKTLHSITFPGLSDKYIAPEMAPEFSTSTAYAVGDYVTYQGSLYKFTSAHSVGSWDSTEVTLVELAEEVTDLKSALYKYTGNKRITAVTGAYIPLNNDTVDITSPVDNAEREYIVVPCSVGDDFTIDVSLGAYAFISSGGSKLITSGSARLITKEVVTAPENSAYLVINSYLYAKIYAYYGKFIIDKVETFEFLKDSLDPVLNDYYEYTNIDISQDIQNGYYENGQYTANSNYRSIKYYCSPGESFRVCSYLREVNHWSIVYFYDSGDSIIASCGGVQDGTLTADTYYENYEFTVPNGTIYFTISSYNVSGKPLRLMKRSLVVSDDRRKVSYRYLENLTVENGYYDSGTFYPHQSYQSIKLSCNPKDRFLVDAYFYDAARQSAAQFYDENMLLIGKTPAITTSGQQNNIEIIIPNGCSYVVFSNFKIVDNVSFNVRKYINGELPLFQKNYIAIGDSITAISNGWRPWFNKVTGATEVMCTAVSGATLCDYDDTVVDGDPEATAHSNTISNQVQQILNNPPEKEINFIIIAAGTNDHASAAEFDGGVTQFVDGNSNYIDVDTIDRTRYDGAMRWIAEKLWSQFPNADIFWCTPIQGAAHTRAAWLQIRKCDYMKEIASHLATPVIDATRNSGIYGRYENDGSSGKYLNDGLHPNMYGRKKLGLYYAGQVINYYAYEID